MKRDSDGNKQMGLKVTILCVVLAEDWWVEFAAAGHHGAARQGRGRLQSRQPCAAACPVTPRHRYSSLTGGKSSQGWVKSVPRAAGSRMAALIRSYSAHTARHAASASLACRASYSSAAAAAAAKSSSGVGAYVGVWGGGGGGSSTRRQHTGQAHTPEEDEEQQVPQPCCQPQPSCRPWASTMLRHHAP